MRKKEFLILILRVFITAQVVLGQRQFLEEALLEVEEKVRSAFNGYVTLVQV